MRILMLVNWKVTYCEKEPPKDKQPPDYVVTGQPYWFTRYFREQVRVDVIDIRSFPWLESFEKEKLRFYVIQALRALPKLKKYDLIISHGFQSGVVLSLFRRLVRTKAKHMVFEIGSFQSASEQGAALKLMQFASKSIDGLIYHTSTQREYYRRFFPWIEGKSRFIPFGADVEFFHVSDAKETGQNAEAGEPRRCILCVGYAKRDWDTLYKAFQILVRDGEIAQNVRDSLLLRFIGRDGFSGEDHRVEAVPYLPVRALCGEIEAAAFCVVPLREFNYSFGQMTLLQQMAMGKAVIASAVSSLKDYGKDEETVLFYEPEQAQELAQKMKRLLLDEKLCRRLGEQAGESVRAYYNERRMAEDVESFLQELVKGEDVNR